MTYILVALLWIGGQVLAVGNQGTFPTEAACQQEVPSPSPGTDYFCMTQEDYTAYMAEFTAA